MSEAPPAAEVVKKKKSKKPSSKVDAGIKWDTWGKIAAAVGAFFVTATATLTFFLTVVNEEKEEARSEVQDLSQQLQEAADAAGELSASFAGREIELSARVKELETENAGLREQLGLPDRSSSPTSDTPAVWHEGPLEVRNGSPNTDLDAPQTDPQWGRFSSNADHEQLLSNGISIHFSKPFMLMDDSEADYNTCLTAPNYITSGDIEIIDLLVGSNVCVLTSEGRYALLKVTDSTDETVAFDITVWDKE